MSGQIWILPLAIWVSLQLWIVNFTVIYFNDLILKHIQTMSQWSGSMYAHTEVIRGLLIVRCDPS